MFKYFFSFITILLTVNGFGQSSITIQGKIVEKGTHDELISHQGTYNKLVTMQSFES